jgi:hypothetical protein
MVTVQQVLRGVSLGLSVRGQLRRPWPVRSALVLCSQPSPPRSSSESPLIGLVIRLAEAMRAGRPNATCHRTAGGLGHPLYSHLTTVKNAALAGRRWLLTGSSSCLRCLIG